MYVWGGLSLTRAAYTTAQRRAVRRTVAGGHRSLWRLRDGARLQGRCSGRRVKRDMLTLDLVGIDTKEWKPHDRTPVDRSWLVGFDAFRFRLIDGPSPEDSVEGWRRRAAQETAMQGGTSLS